MSTFVELILPLAIPKLLTYQVPASLQGLISPGTRVMVALGKKQVTTGIVQNMHHNTPHYPTKAILGIFDEMPIVTPMQLDFFQWLAQYYLCHLGEILKTALPSGFRLNSQSKIQLNPNWDPTHTKLSADELAIVETLQKKDVIDYQQLTKKPELNPVIKGLIQKQVILVFESIQEKYQPKKEKRISLHETYRQDPAKMQALFDQLDKKPKQLEILLQYLSLAPSQDKEEAKDKKDATQGFIPKKQLLATAIASHALQSLIKQNILVEQTLIVSRLTSIQPPKEAQITLSPAQNEALEAIKEKFTTHDTVLLQGITSSGKTEIYIQLIQEAFLGGGQVLYLLPEIGLATQIVRRLQKIFGDQMAVYHSKYASNERVEIWHQVLQAKVSLVIGVRSALFLPFHNLSLIIIDEEHELAYKQLDAIPRYHARDAALMLARFHQAKVLLGSATPALETYYHAQTGKYGFVQLTERYNQTPLPQLTLVNTREAQQQKKLQGEFTQPLLQALQQALDQKEQVIIFQNRRGYAPYIRCQACAWVPNCQRCSVSLTYHQYNNHLICHYCGYKTHIPPTCEVCDSRQLLNVGFGTEKLAETLQQFFPDKHIQRMDLDTTRGKYSYEKIIDGLEQGQIDILVGTQMITKGLDFGQVSLVGVVDVDRHLYFPDFRSNERCFQLITQVSGRAGRRNKQGQVLIQTANPEHPVLQTIIQQDYDAMYQKELAERQKFLYPPYVRLVKITLQHTDNNLLKEASDALTEQLKQQLGQAWILGPQAPLIAKIKHQYRMDSWVKIKKAVHGDLTTTKHHIQMTAHQILSQQAFRPIRLIFDVDPV